LQAAQVLKLGHHIDQRGIERRVEQAKVVVKEGWHVRVPNKNPESLTHYLQTDNDSSASGSGKSEQKQHLTDCV
jgi:hypothetical protein